MKATDGAVPVLAKLAIVQVYAVFALNAPNDVPLILTAKEPLPGVVTVLDEVVILSLVDAPVTSQV